MPMKDALGELRQGAVDLANKIRPKGIAAGASVQPAAPAATTAAPPTGSMFDDPAMAERGMGRINANYQANMSRAYPGMAPTDIPAYQRRGVTLGNSVQGNNGRFMSAPDKEARALINEGTQRFQATANRALGDAAAQTVEELSAGGKPVAPAGVPPVAENPGMLARAKTIGGKALNLGGNVAGVAAGGYGAYEAGKDIASRGANLDNTTSLAGNAALAGGSAASLAGVAGAAPVAVGAGSFLAGKSIGSSLADAVLSPFVDRSTEQYARGTADIDELNRVAAENPNGRLAQSIRGGNSMGGMLTAPAAAPAVAAPAATDGAATPPSGTQFFAPGSAGARGIRARINDRSFVPASGTGLVTNNTTGAAVSLDSRQPASGAAPAPLSDRDLVAATLRDQMVNGRNGRSRREAAQRMADLLNNEATSETARQRLRFDSGKYNAELGDKRIEDFNKQFVNNQFYRSEKDKDGNVRDVPDTAMNAQFLDFMRNTDPRFATPDGMAEINALGSQARNKLIGELRQAFLEKQNVESTLEGSKLIGDVERSNRRISIGGVREAGVGDIPDIGLSGYLWSNLPFTDRNVVETDRGKVLASNFIGKGEGSADRRARIYSKEK